MAFLGVSFCASVTAPDARPPESCGMALLGGTQGALMLEVTSIPFLNALRALVYQVVL